MASELELANQKIAELAKRLAIYQNQEETLIPLPNKDLHRGFRKFVERGDNIEGSEAIPDAAINPLDRAMAKCLRAASGGGPLECLWCGLQLSEPDLRAHISKDHPSIVEGWDSKKAAEILMVDLANANEKLGKKE